MISLVLPLGGDAFCLTLKKKKKKRKGKKRNVLKDVTVCKRECP